MKTPEEERLIEQLTHARKLLYGGVMLVELALRDAPLDHDAAAQWIKDAIRFIGQR